MLSLAQESFLERKENLKTQRKIEIPMNIDTKKYFIGGIAFMDLLILVPALLVGFAIVGVYYTIAGSVNQVIIITACTPVLLAAVLQLTKHPERKNVSLLQFKLLWKLNYNRRIKKFYYSKGDMNMDTTKEGAGDVRAKLPVSNIANGCIETKDNRLVKVIEVSSVNLSLMNDTDRENVLTSYQNFINELEENQIQIEQVAQPINLASYSAWITDVGREDKPQLRKLKESYLKQTDDIQKNKSMVTRKRYISISVKNKTNAYDTIELKANNIQFKLENMLDGYERLTARILKNDELIRLIYTCIDFENAQSQGEGIVNKAKNNSPIIVGNHTYEELEKQAREEVASTFR